MWLYFFFFKQKTAYEMRISDWSSDVCSSDLVSPSSPSAPVAAAISPETKLPVAEAKNHVPMMSEAMCAGASRSLAERPTGARQISPVVCRSESRKKKTTGVRLALPDAEAPATHQKTPGQRLKLAPPNWAGAERPQPP